MITKQLEVVGIFEYMRAKWQAEAEGFTVSAFDARVKGDEVIYTATAKKEND
uniref:Uncharacterized protein n=1 Tax=Dinoroseobacter phage vB_DshS_R26L TaxID=3161158 RepID=A0AAU7VGS2_9CAUD